MLTFRTRKLVRPVDLNAGGSLFGGQLLKWIDEEAAIYAMCQLDNQRVTTKFLSEIDFVAPARTGDVIEIGLEVVELGTTSITIRCEARVKKTQRTILKIAKMVFVNLDENLKPLPHNKVLYGDI
jgi:acyl-CoA hydrolase